MHPAARIATSRSRAPIRLTTSLLWCEALSCISTLWGALRAKSGNMRICVIWGFLFLSWKKMWMWYESRSFIMLERRMKKRLEWRCGRDCSVKACSKSFLSNLCNIKMSIFSTRLCHMTKAKWIQWACRASQNAPDWPNQTVKCLDYACRKFKIVLKLFLQMNSFLKWACIWTVASAQDEF